MDLKIIQDLISCNIISLEDGQKLESKFEINPDGPLRALFQFFYEKMFGGSYPSDWFSFSFRVTEIKKEEVNDNQLNIFLSLLFEGQLIGDVTYKKLKNEIDSCQIANDFHLIFRALNLNHFYKNFTKGHQLEFAEQLIGKDFKSSLVNESRKRKLRKDIEKGELQSYLDFFKYCYNCKFFDFKPKENRHALFKRLLTILSNLYIGDFVVDKCSYEIVESKQAKSSGKLVNILLQIANKIHQHSYELREDLVPNMKIITMISRIF